MKLLLIVLITGLLIKPVLAGDIRVAVASNFANTLKQIASLFEKKTGHRLKISVGSTGKQYAQIINGAPFDVFVAADSLHPALLEKEGKTVAGSRFTYARGQLVLWSPQQNLVDPEGRVLQSNDFTYLAIANTGLAPYGKAAQQVLRNKGLWRLLKEKIVRGENIGQTFQFVRSGNAQLGFIALSQLKLLPAAGQGSWWSVPQSEYAVIDQQLVGIKDNSVSQAFLSFMRSDTVTQLIRDAGYQIP